MPIFEYECTKCNYRFERIKVVVVTPEPVQLCVDPECNGKAKLIPSVTAQPQFKGPGFHATDYKGIK